MFGDPILGQNWTQNLFFCHFLKFGSLVFLEIAYDDSLEQCLTTSNCKTNEKKLAGGPVVVQTDQNQVFCNFLKFGSLVFL